MAFTLPDTERGENSQGENEDPSLSKLWRPLYCLCSTLWTARTMLFDSCGETRMKFNWTGQTTRLSTGKILYECSDCGVYVPKSGHLKKCDGPEGKIKRARITAQAF